MHAPLSDDIVFRALADPSRRQTLGLLRTDERSVNEIARNFHVSRPAISKHLRVLRGAGLITDRVEGTSRLCSLNAAPLAAVNDWLENYKIFWTSALQRLKIQMEDS